MSNKHISEFLFSKQTPKHKDIDFVNSFINRDIKLFIDPVLIQIGDSSFCNKVKDKIEDYFQELFKAYYDTKDDNRKKYLLKHAQEINDSHLGYASRYGHGNTEEGLYEIFKGIDNYITETKLRRTYELALFVPRFAEDGMSDLITNIIYKELSEFTKEQCDKYGIKTCICPEDRYYWDDKTHSWQKYNGASMVIEDNVCILVPKEIVRNRYKFTTDNYLRSVIVENICEEQAIFDEKGKKCRPLKDATRKKLIEKNGSVFETVVCYTNIDGRLLDQYQTIVLDKYKESKLSDDELDDIVYATITTGQNRG